MTQESARNRELRAGVLRWLRQILFFVLLLILSLFLSAGRLDWGTGWLFVAVFLAGQAMAAMVLIPTSPELLAERAEIKEDAKGWDRPLVAFVTLLGPLAIWIVAGLDARFGWSSGVSGVLRVLAVVLALLGYGLLTWAMASNPFFSGVVRLQEERGHDVATAGPYRLVRHPGYLAGILVDLVTPLILGSFWAFIPAVLVTSGLVLRTILEDRTLHAELVGYPAYAQRTRHRLLPGVW
jgi:protein-S-isoprenylcysteine O-methyltransferase Ste14